jgi:hypothetical protein
MCRNDLRPAQGFLMKKKPKVLAVLGFVLLLAYIIYASMNLSQVTCEVCITYRGRTECRTAQGTNAEEAQRTATDVACTLLSSGMTENIACGNTPPAKLMCTER